MEVLTAALVAGGFTVIVALINRADKNSRSDLKPMKRFFLSALLALVLTACADRYRENCNTTKANGLLERRCA